LVAQPSYAERRKLQLREEIIDAAIKVFADSGADLGHFALFSRRFAYWNPAFCAGQRDF